MTRRSLSSWIGLVLSWLPALAPAYEIRTHGEITRHAYDASEGLQSYLTQTGIPETQTFVPEEATPRTLLARFVNTGTVQGWMIEGTIREDDFSKSFIGIVFGCVQPENPPSQ